MLRIGRVFDLMNRARVQREFEEQVVADAPQQVERSSPTSSTGSWTRIFDDGRR